MQKLWNHIWSQIPSQFYEYIPLTVVTGILLANLNVVFDTLKNPHYWQTLLTKALNIVKSVLDIFKISNVYLGTTAILIIVICLIFNLLIKKVTRRYIEKIKYDPAEHASFYTSNILKRKNHINTKEEFDAFVCDFVSDLHNL